MVPKSKWAHKINGPGNIVEIIVGTSRVWKSWAPEIVPFEVSVDPVVGPKPWAPNHVLEIIVCNQLQGNRETGNNGPGNLSGPMRPGPVTRGLEITWYRGNHVLKSWARSCDPNHGPQIVKPEMRGLEIALNWKSRGLIVCLEIAGPGNRQARKSVARNPRGPEIMGRKSSTGDIVILEIRGLQSC